MKLKAIHRLFHTIGPQMDCHFIQKYNAMSGQIEWQSCNQDYDEWQSVARSAFGDMVNDWHRNKLYYRAIKKVVTQLKTRKPDLLCLDIGTGTGLLSMMAVKSGVDRVVACDSFEPIGECAKEIVARNGLSNRIKIITKRSDNLTVGSQDSDLDRRADILVAELFDTELIGEGAIATYSHAVRNLLASDAVLVPSRARIYCQLVESESLFACHQFNDKFEINDNLSVETPRSVMSCEGSNVLHDIQINELKPNIDFTIVSKPEVIFEFKFNDLSTLKTNDKKVIEFKAIQDINGPIVLFMWWDLDMDTEGEIVLSCAPFWTYDDPSVTSKSIPWRDHWMQSVYYFPAYNKALHLKSNQTVKVVAKRDEYSLWFDLLDDPNHNRMDSPSVQCKCGLHLFLSRTRIQMINDISRLRRYQEIIDRSLTSDSTDAIFLGDSSLLPIVSAKLNKIRKVFCLTTNRQTEDFIRTYADSNGLDNKVEIVRDFDQIEDKSVGLVLSEPYFNSSDLPWNHLHFWYLKNSIPSNLLADNFLSLPNKAVIKAIPIEFDNLWRIHAEVGSDVEGFDLSIYDQLIRKAVSLSDSSIESQPLWEYPGKAMTEKALQLFQLDLTKAIGNQEVLRTLVKFDVTNHLEKLKTKYISIAFWVEFYFCDQLIETSGPTQPIVNGEYIQWNRHYRQGVTFLPNLERIQRDKLLTLNMTYDLNEGEISCGFDVL